MKSARLEVSVEYPPRTLTICVRRTSGDLTKMSKHLSFGIDLDVSGHLSLMMAQREANYRLSSIVVHEGVSSGSGHYRAYVLRSEGWYECNDERVQPVEESVVLAQFAYILFYELV
ncbi:Ubiquitin carboxyl-terminal hydrolase [Perkinsus olseni]|uniref:ubiquitinyl hydrolase 1 n=2 Tax=Perkinsus olseni TaxID=32597 RepID=A0A7J6PGQ1_PEROL|nr:Ubiquitin carboxyl-terminal hydrolase [Perkinsus olseni]KAF4709399.1 Ubiquitin carboxyl-terminal hydrolase [Perkinsus olseni]